jgi:hypothetical protein
MTDAISACLRLRRIAAALRAGQLPDPDDAEPLVDGIDAYLSGSVPTLDAALGIASNQRGGISGRRAAALAERDAALVELAGLVGGTGEGENAEATWNIAEALSGLVEIEDDEDQAEATRLVALINAATGRPLSRRQISRILSEAAPDIQS